MLSDKNILLNIVIKSLINMLFPRLCGGCGERLVIGEEAVCTSCQMQLPLEKNHDWELNKRKMIWSSHQCLVRMGALTKYERDNIASNIVRSLKFHRRYELGAWMGRTAVVMLRDTGLFDGIDCLIPIPLTRSRQHARGFNQAEAIAKGMAEELNIPIRTDVLQRTVNRESQTHFAVPQRLENAQRVFRLVNVEGLSGKHVMIVDDVMTTGTTMLGAIEELEAVPDIHISTFAWAWAHVPPVAHT